MKLLSPNGWSELKVMHPAPKTLGRAAENNSTGEPHPRPPDHPAAGCQGAPFIFRERQGQGLGVNGRASWPKRDDMVSLFHGGEVGQRGVFTTRLA